MHLPRRMRRRLSRLVGALGEMASPTSPLMVELEVESCSCQAREARVRADWFFVRWGVPVGRLRSRAAKAGTVPITVARVVTYYCNPEREAVDLSVKGAQATFFLHLTAEMSASEPHRQLPSCTLLEASSPRAPNPLWLRLPLMANDSSMQ